MSKEKIRLQEAGPDAIPEDDSLEADILEAFGAELEESGDLEGAGIDERGEGAEPAETPKESFEADGKAGKAAGLKKEPGEKTAPDTQEAKPLDPPARFNNSEKEVFKSLPREAQEAIARLEQASRKYHSSVDAELNNERAQFNELKRVVTPYEGKLLGQGMTLPKLVEGYINTQLYAERDPVGAVAAFAQRLGVDPRELVESPHQGAQQVSPEVAKMRQELAELRGYVSHQQTAAQRQIQTQRISEFESFVNAKDEGGQPQFPFAEHDSFGNPVHPQFVQRMATELKLLRQQNPKASTSQLLREAYETTSYVDPTARNARLEAERARERAEQDRRAKEARRGGKSISNSLGSTRSDASDDLGLDDEIERFVEGHYA